MFRSMSGFKAQYQGLTVLVIEEFNEWRVLIYGAGTTIHGARQFSEAKAKEHAMTVARCYIQDQKHGELASLDQMAWEPATPEDWLVWR